MAQWYAQIGSQRYGPVSEEEIKSWYTQGRVKPTDHVWSEGMANWAPAGSTFGAAPTPGGPGPAMTVQQPQYVSAQLPAAPGAVTSMVCGIIGVAVNCTGLILGIIALKQAKMAKEAIAACPGQYGGEGMATAGHVLGIIGIILGSISLLVILVYLILIGTLVSGAAFR